MLRNLGVERKDSVMENSEVIGVLEIHVHQARDIRNICIYRNQDVYAKLYMTSDPEKSVSTQIVDGGGKNPVFNENLCVDVRTIGSSLKCEIWMLSRAKNYLEDQLLGSVLVPLSDVLVAKGKLIKEFSLSICDMFHSPSGFVQLSLAYTGASPEVLDITSSSSLAANIGCKDSELPSPTPCELDKIEFPDPKIVNENHMMVSEYFGISCVGVDTQGSESLSTADNDKHLKEFGARFLDGFSRDGVYFTVPTVGSPPSSISTPATAQSICHTPGEPQSPNQDLVLSEREKITGEVGEAGCGSPAALGNAVAKHAVSVNIEKDQVVVQQEIVDMYLKSMQQFTETLEKMNLPVDTQNGPANAEGTSSDEKFLGSKGNGSRLFYGSRAFF